jgi:hypothetical protein
MARPATLFEVTLETADSRCVIECAFLNESRRNAILISGPMLKGKRLEFNQIAFLAVSTDRPSVGQQHRVRAKRKRRRAYLQRKKTALRVSARRPAPGKQRRKKEPGPEE